jgi:hypothetical protein
MSQLETVLVDRVFGWKVTDDNTHVVVGFSRGPHNSEFAIAFSHDVLVNTIISMVGALDAFQEVRTPSGDLFSIDAEWFEVSKVEGRLVVAFRTKGGGFLRFAMDRAMIERLSGALSAGLGNVSTSGIP